MFAAAHLAVGALVEAGLKRKLLTAVVAFASAAILDSTEIWHAPYPWPQGSPAILHVLPYPHDLPSILTVIALIVSTIAVVLLLRQYWWGMLFAIAPDIIDWVILRPIVGHGVIHSLFSWLATPWGFAYEMAFIIIIVVVLLKKKPTLSRGGIGKV